MKTYRFLLIEVKRKETLEFIDNLYKEDKENYLISFWTIDKFGINPNPFYFRTPLGIYAYRIKDFKEKYGNKIENIPFGNKRQYILVFKINPDAKILMASKIKKEDVDKLKNLFKEKYKIENIPELKKYKETEKFFHILKNLSEEIYKEKPYIVQYNILKDMGYDLVIDDGTASLCASEPYQVLVVNPRKITHVKTLYNPYFSEKDGNEELREIPHFQFKKEGSFIDSFFFLLLRNRMNLKNEKNINNLLFFLKNNNKDVSIDIFEKIINEIKSYIEKIYSLSSTKEFYNPFEAILVYFPLFKNEIEKIFLKYGIEKNISNKEIFHLMKNFFLKKSPLLYFYFFENIHDRKKYFRDFFTKPEELFPKKLNKNVIDILSKIVNDFLFLFNKEELLYAFIVLALSDNKKHNELAKEIFEDIYSEKGELFLDEILKYLKKLKRQENNFHLEELKNFINNFIDEIYEIEPYFKYLLFKGENKEKSKKKALEKIRKIVEKYFDFPLNKEKTEKISKILLQ